MEEKHRWKLLPKNFGSFRITERTSHRTTIEEGRKRNEISIYQDTLTPRLEMLLQMNNRHSTHYGTHQRPNETINNTHWSARHLQATQDYADSSTFYEIKLTIEISAERTTFVI